MLAKTQNLWNSLRSVLHRVGSFFYKHFKHITGAVRHVADKIHSWNVGPVSTVAGLVSTGTHVADHIYDYAHDLFGHTPPNTENPFTGLISGASEGGG